MKEISCFWRLYARHHTHPLFAFLCLSSFWEESKGECVSLDGIKGFWRLHSRECTLPYLLPEKRRTEKREWEGECAALSRYLANVPILSVVSCCSWSRWKTLIPSERPTVGIKLIREIKIMNYCKGVKNIQFPLQPKTILIPSMVPPIQSCIKLKKFNSSSINAV